MILIVALYSTQVELYNSILGLRLSRSLEFGHPPWLFLGEKGRGRLNYSSLKNFSSLTESGGWVTMEIGVRSITCPENACNQQKLT